VGDEKNEKTNAGEKLRRKDAPGKRGKKMLWGLVRKKAKKYSSLQEKGGNGWYS